MVIFQVIIILTRYKLMQVLAVEVYYPDGSGWAKMAYLGWKTLGMNYLRSLNQYANGELRVLGRRS
jgi:hypothetical protein